MRYEIRQTNTYHLDIELPDLSLDTDQIGIQDDVMDELCNAVTRVALESTSDYWVGKNLVLEHTPKDEEFQKAMMSALDEVKSIEEVDTEVMDAFLEEISNWCFPVDLDIDSEDLEMEEY